MTDAQNNPEQQGAQPEAGQSIPAQPVQQAATQAQAAPAKSALAIVSMVLGIIALLLSLLPIINNFAFVLVILGIVFAVVGIVGTGAGKKAGRGFAIAGLVLSIAAGIAVIASQSFYGAVLDAASESISTTSSASSSSEPDSSAGEGSSSAESSADAAVEAEPAQSKYAVTIDSCKQTKDYGGNKAIIVTYTWTNNSDSDTSFMVAISDKAFQNDIQLETAIVDGVDSQALMRDVKPGKSLEVQQAFKLDDKSDVKVECSELISFSDELIAEKTFKIK